MTPTEAAYLLDVSQDAAIERIEEARRREARLWHPDRQTDPEVAQFASDRMSRINQAADLLIKPHGTKGSNRFAQQPTDDPATGDPPAKDVKALIAAGQTSLLILAGTVTVLAPFLPLTMVYGLALVAAVSAGFAIFVRALRNPDDQSP